MAYSSVPEPPESPPAESSGSEIRPQHSQSEQQMTSLASDAAVTENVEAPPAPVRELTPAVANETSNTAAEIVEKWPGWPGYNVFRLVVPVVKVGSIIGRKGELVKKLCDETHARVRILEGPIGTADRIVLISGKEDPDAELSPAMIAVLRIFKSVSGLSPTEGDDTGSVTGVVCSIRLLVSSSQAIHLIGKQGTTIKSIQEGSGASIRVSSEDEGPSYATPDERIIEIHGDVLKVLKALETILRLLRKFLVDHSVVPIFEKTYNATIAQDRSVKSRDDKTQSFVHPASAATAPQAGNGSDFSLSLKGNSFLFEGKSQLDPEIPHSGPSFYGQDTSFGGLRSAGFGRPAGPIVTQITKTMQVPLSYAEDIIGIGGANIAYIRSSSGAILTVQESRGLPDEITVEIKGTSSQVQTAEQLIQEFINTHKEPAPSIYGRIDNGFTSYSHLANSYSPSSFPSQPLGGYGSSSVGGYSNFRF